MTIRVGAIRLAKSIVGILASFGAFWISAPAYAAEIAHKVMQGGENVIVIFGEIQNGDNQKFNNIAASVSSATVLLHSPGGALLPAIEIGKSLRLKGYSTLVMNGSDCQSACGLIWLAGSPRRLSRSAKIGFHSIYELSRGAPITSSAGNAVVGRYLTLLNLPEKAVIFATASPPESFNWLNSSNYTKVGIDLSLERDYGSTEENKFNSPEAQPEDLKASLPETYKWSEVGLWDVFVDRTLGNACFLLATFEKGTALRIGFQNNSNTSGLIFFGHETWSSLVKGNEYELTAQFGSATPWTLPTIAIEMGGAILLRAKFSDVRVWEEFAREDYVSLDYKGRSVAKLSLNGSSKAFDELVNCQKAQRAKLADDPFAE